MQSYSTTKGPFLDRYGGLCRATGDAMALCRQAKNTAHIGGCHRLHLGKRHAF